MSSNLYWQPITDGLKDITTDVKLVMRKTWKNGLDGIVLDSSDKEYFRGLADCEIVGAQKVLDALEEHGEIRLTEKF